jgi:hypothetical protein
MHCWRALLLILVTSSAARANDLWLLTRDGALHRLKDGAETGTAPRFESPQAFARLGDGRLAIVHAGKLVLTDGQGTTKSNKVIKGAFADVRELAAADAHLYASTAKSEIVELDVATGKRKAVGTVPKSRLIAAFGNAVYAAHDDTIDTVGGKLSVKLDSRVTTLTAANAKIYATTKSGKLWEIDSATAVSRELGFGNWWATVALASDGGMLYLVTQAGKLWKLDLAAGTKDALAMDGWQNAYGLAVAKE